MSADDSTGTPGPEDATRLRHVPLPPQRLPSADAAAGKSWSAPAPTPPGPPPAAVPPRRDGTRAGLLAGMTAAIVLLAGGGGFYVGRTHTGTASATTVAQGTDFSGSLPAGGADPVPSASGGTTPDGNTTPTTSAAPTVDPETAALQQLGQLRSESLARLPMDDRWVAQVSSKSVGITDPLQTAQNGSHTFLAADILAESLAARQRVADPDQNVYVVWGTDFGKRSQAADGSPYWITLVDGGFGSSAAVKAWCQSTYPTLTPAQLADTCAPRQLTPPHS